MATTVTFEIGDEQVEIPELTWDIIQDDVMPILDSMRASPEKEFELEFLRLREAQLSVEAANYKPPKPQDGNIVQLALPDPRSELAKVKAQLAAEGVRWYVSRGNDIKILASALKYIRPDLTYDIIRRKLTFAGAEQVSRKLGDLLRLSGFGVANPTETETEEVKDSTSTTSSPISSTGDTHRPRSGTK